MSLAALKAALTGKSPLGPAWTVASTSYGLSKYERLAWYNLQQRYPRRDLATVYFARIGATRTVLERRACYGGRKGNSARRKLGITPSTSALAARTVFTLRALQQAARYDRWVGSGTTDLVHWTGPHGPIPSACSSACAPGCRGE